MCHGVESHVWILVELTEWHQFDWGLEEWTQMKLLRLQSYTQHWELFKLCLAKLAEMAQEIMKARLKADS